MPGDAVLVDGSVSVVSAAVVSSVQIGSVFVACVVPPSALVSLGAIRRCVVVFTGRIRVIVSVQCTELLSVVFL